MNVSDKNIGAMLSLTLEIEGLLLLLQRRGDLVHPEVATLLNQKIAQLGQYAGGISDVVDEPATIPVAVTEQSEPTNENEAYIEPTTHINPAPVIESPVEDKPSASVTPEEDAIAASAEFEEIEHADMTEPVCEEPAVAPEVSVPSVTSAKPEAPSPNPLAVPKFTLNDRFRFRNNLFGGDDKEFSDTLAVISEMSSAREVEEYVTEDLCLDSSDPDVADFLAIVTARFA